MATVLYTLGGFGYEIAIPGTGPADLATYSHSFITWNTGTVAARALNADTCRLTLTRGAGAREHEEFRADLDGGLVSAWTNDIYDSGSGVLMSSKHSVLWEANSQSIWLESAIKGHNWLIDLLTEARPHVDGGSVVLTGLPLEAFSSHRVDLFVTVKGLGLVVLLPTGLPAAEAPAIYRQGERKTNDDSGLGLVLDFGDLVASAEILEATPNESLEILASATFHVRGDR